MPVRVVAAVIAVTFSAGVAVPQQVQAVGKSSRIQMKVHEKRAVKLVKTRKKLSRIQRNKLTGRRMVARFGWSKRNYRCLRKLWNRESGWNHRAHNGGSGAHGIPQALPGRKMASAGRDWRTNPKTQIRWGLRYIKHRYGSPCHAWGHFGASGWY